MVYPARSRNAAEAAFVNPCFQSLYSCMPFWFLASFSWTVCHWNRYTSSFATWERQGRERVIVCKTWHLPSSITLWRTLGAKWLLDAQSQNLDIDQFVGNKWERLSVSKLPAFSAYSSPFRPLPPERVICPRDIFFSRTIIFRPTGFHCCTCDFWCFRMLLKLAELVL